MSVRQIRLGAGIIRVDGPWVISRPSFVEMIFDRFSLGEPKPIYIQESNTAKTSGGIQLDLKYFSNQCLKRISLR